MPLTIRDIKRIRKEGYDPNDFIVEKNGQRQLKNLKGSCYFLKKGYCTIYSHRPEGCRLYPLIYNPSKRTVIIDPLCSHREEFSINEYSAKQQRKLVKKINRETRRELLY
jgi:hypothetical protein